MPGVCSELILTGECGRAVCPFGHDLSLFCRPCSDSSFNRYHANQHRKSQNHKALASRLAAHCKLCKEDLKEGWAQHCQSARHREANVRSPDWVDPPFPAYRELTEPALGHIRCVVCHIDVAQDRWEQHVGLTAHRVKWTLTILPKRLRNRAKKDSSIQAVNVSCQEGVDFGVVDRGVRRDTRGLTVTALLPSIRIESAMITSVIEGKTDATTCP